MSKREKLLALCLEKSGMVYFLVYYLIGVHFSLLPTLDKWLTGSFSMFNIYMLILYFSLVILSQVVTAIGVDFFSKEKV